MLAYSAGLFLKNVEQNFNIVFCPTKMLIRGGNLHKLKTNYIYILNMGKISICLILSSGFNFNGKTPSKVINYC